MTDPVVNAFTLKMEYSDEELQLAMEQRIAAIVRVELRKLLSDPSVGECFIVNNAYRLEQISKQAFKNAIASINTY